MMRCAGGSGVRGSGGRRGSFRRICRQNQGAKDPKKSDLSLNEWLAPVRPPEVTGAVWVSDRPRFRPKLSRAPMKKSNF